MSLQNKILKSSALASILLLAASTASAATFTSVLSETWWMLAILAIGAGLTISIRNRQAREKELVALANDTTQTNIREVPVEIAAELEILHQALLQCPHLLQQGRSFGFGIGLSPRVSEVFMASHGSDFVINNCWAVDTQRPQ